MKTQVKRLLFLAVLIILVSVAARPVPPKPNVQITLINGLPAVMNVGETYTVEVLVTSDTPFTNAIAQSSEYFPGRYVVAQGGGDIAQAGMSATLTIPFIAKASTAGLPGNVAPVSVTAGVRYPGGVVVTQRFDFNVAVP